jgi:hypothetical protein
VQKGSSCHFSKRRSRRSPDVASRNRRSGPGFVQARTWAGCMQGQPDSFSMPPQLVVHEQQLVPYPRRMGAAKFFGMCPAPTGVSNAVSGTSTAPWPQPTVSQPPWPHTIQTELSQERSPLNSHLVNCMWKLHAEEPRSGICGIPPSPFPVNNPKAPCCQVLLPLQDHTRTNHAGAWLDACMYSAACDTCMHSGGPQPPERVPGIPCFLEAAADSRPGVFSSHSGHSSTELQAIPQHAARASLEVATCAAHCAAHSEHTVALEGRVPVLDRGTRDPAATTRISVDSASDEGVQEEAEFLSEARAAVIAARKAKTVKNARSRANSGSTRVALQRDCSIVPSTTLPASETVRSRSTSPLGAIELQLGQG